MGADREDADRRPSAYVGTIVANVVFLWFVNAIPGWNWSFITADFVAVLWAVNLSIAFQIAGNALLIFFHPRLVHYVAQAVMSAVSLLAGIVLLAVFPFAFASPGNLVARIVLWIAIAGTAIGVVVNLLKGVGSLFGRDE